jgi:hypothetical protein
VTLPPAVAFSVKVDALIVDGVIASLKAALKAWLIGTPVAPFVGTVEITVGKVAAGTVLNRHT